MIQLFGVEMAVFNENEFNQHLAHMTEIVPIYDIDDQLLIVKKKEDAISIKDYLKKQHLFEECYRLYQLEQPQITNLFYDYGFQSENDQYFLYSDTTIPFTILNGDKNQIKMVQYQLEEHLLAIEQENEIYFIDRQQIELIYGYAKAYDIEVSFFDLDKMSKND